MAKYVVMLSDRTEQTVDVPDLPAWAAARRALYEAGPAAFCARPLGCTGLAWNVHHGAEQACPVHRED
jgi:hypothetical protein